MFVVAAELKKTIGEIRQTMGKRELNEWFIYLKMKSKKAESKDPVAVEQSLMTALDKYRG